MNRTTFRRRIPTSRKLRMLAAAAIAALALSACGGGGGSGGRGLSGPGPSTSGPSTPDTSTPDTSTPGPSTPDTSTPAVSTLAPSLTAEGVTAVVEYDTANSAASLSIKKGSTVWTDSPTDVQAAPTGWASETRLDAAAATATERFRVVAKIASATDGDYLAYGYWNGIPLDGVDDYKPFYYGQTPYTGNVAEQTGSATYNGGATGVYRTSSDTSAINGRFTANAAVYLSIGGDPAAVRMQISLSNIATLTSAGSAGPTLDNLTTGLFAATITDSSFTRPSGSHWGGQFFGPSGALPTGIAGWFENQLARNTVTNASVFLNGTFGAKR